MKPPSAAAPPEPLTRQSTFEGLFVHVLEVKPGTPFALALARAGYDVARQEPTYSGAVWKACLEIACEHVYPGRPMPAALRELGRRFLGGFFQTLAGRATGLLISALGPDAIIKRFPRFWSMGGTGAEMVFTSDGPRTCLLEVSDRYPTPDFDAGVVEAALMRSGVTPEVLVVETRPYGYTLRVSW